MTYTRKILPKILIVDDLEENRIALRRLLAKVDAEIIESTSGNEALALTIDHDFALILLDVNMPGMDGYEVSEILHGEEQSKRVPVIFVTAADKDDIHRVKGYPSGAVDYIEKPIIETILMLKVGRKRWSYPITSECVPSVSEKVPSSTTTRTVRVSLTKDTKLSSVSLLSPAFGWGGISVWTGLSMSVSVTGSAHPAIVLFFIIGMEHRP